MIGSFTLASDALNSEQCDTLISNGLQLSETVEFYSFGSVWRIDRAKRTAIVRQVPLDADCFSGLHSMLSERFHKANADVFGVDIGYLRYVQFLEYRDDLFGGHDWHSDSRFLAKTPWDFKLTLVANLSNAEDYEGGDLEIEMPGYSLVEHTAKFRERGSVIIFPSMWRHRVTPVTRGVRHSLSAFMEGPKWR